MVALDCIFAAKEFSSYESMLSAADHTAPSKVAPGACSGKETELELAPKCTAECVAKWLEEQDTSRLCVFLRRRHEARFFGPIECLRTASNTHEGYGFSMMALCCLLVETIQCYREGMPTTSRIEWRALVSIQKNELVPLPYQLQKTIPKRDPQVFEQFFCDFQDFFPNVNGSDFYRNIRNGLLHQAQTKDGWTIDTRGSLICEPAPKKHINRSLFAQALKSTFDKYLADLQQKRWNAPEWKHAATKMWWLIRISR